MHFALKSWTRTIVLLIKAYGYDVNSKKYNGIIQITVLLINNYKHKVKN